MDHCLPYLKGAICVREWCFFQLTNCLIWCATRISHWTITVHLLYISMIFPLSQSTLSLFADDVYTTLSFHTEASRLSTPSDSNLCEWTDDSHLQLNRTKCKFMVISRKRQRILPSQPLTINHSQLERVYIHIQYLGVWLTSTLNWSTQITEISKKARSQLGIIYRNFYRRPRLEYAAIQSGRDPRQVGFIHSLERIQQFALRMCTKKWNLDYNILLDSCDIPSLAVRRQHLKLFLVPTDKWSHNFP